MNTISAVVLAAGSSARLGHPKALVALDGSTALGLVLRSLRDASVTRGVVVLGEHAAAIEAALDPHPFAWVRNPDSAAGRTGSVQAGLAALDPADDVLLWPVDRPFAGADVVRALVTARDADVVATTGVWVPCAAGRSGHPILLRAEVLPGIRDAPPAESLRDILRRSGRTKQAVPVGDEGMHWNLDTGEDVERARAWRRSRGT